MVVKTSIYVLCCINTLKRNTLFRKKWLFLSFSNFHKNIAFCCKTFCPIVQTEFYVSGGWVRVKKFFSENKFRFWTLANFFWLLLENNSAGLSEVHFLRPFERFDENITFENKNFFLLISGHWVDFSAFCQQKYSGIFRTAFHLSIGRFSAEKIWCCCSKRQSTLHKTLKKMNNLKETNVLFVRLLPPQKLFYFNNLWPVCPSWILHTRRNSLTENIFFLKNLFVIIGHWAINLSFS